MTVDVGAIAAALCIAKRSAERRAAKEQWPFEEHAVRGGRRRVYALATLPTDVQTAVLLATRKNVVDNTSPRCQQQETRWSDERRQQVWARYDRAPQTRKDLAARRLQALRAVQALVDQGNGLVSARGVVASQLQRDGMRGGSAASLGRWADDVRGAPRDCWLPLLLPSYAGRIGKVEIPEQAWDLFKADYLRAEAPTATGCYERVQRIAQREGWTLPCLRTFERRIEEQLPRQVLILARQGAEALLRTFPPQQRDHGVFGAMQAVNADGHRFDVFARWPDGTIARPTMVAWQCIGSGKLLARRVGQTENSDLVRLSFADMARQYGCPQHAWLDNGRGFANKFLTGGTPTRYRFKVRPDDPVGVLTALVDEIHWATPYHGQAKPIERAFLDLADRVSKHPAFAGAYTGNRPDAKPENYGSHAVPIAEFLRVLDEELLAHNRRQGRRGGVCNGRSFDEVFADSYRQTAIRKATAEQLRTLLLCSDKVTAHRHDGSITLAGLGNRYWTEALAPYAGQQLLARFDPDSLHSEIAAYTLAGEFIADVPCIAAVGFADTQAGRDHARARKQWRNAARSQLDAERRMDAAKLAAQIPSPPPEDLPAATVVQGAFGRGEATRPAQPERRAAEPLQRTGTDDAPQAALGDLLKRMQQRQNAEIGFEPDSE